MNALPSLEIPTAPEPEQPTPAPIPAPEVPDPGPAPVEPTPDGPGAPEPSPPIQPEPGAPDAPQPDPKGPETLSGAAGSAGWHAFLGGEFPGVAHRIGVAVARQQIEHTLLDQALHVGPRACVLRQLR